MDRLLLTKLLCILLAVIVFGYTFNTTMKIVLDTNVICSVLRSRRGASSMLLRMLGSEAYEAHLTVPLYLEYVEQAQRIVASGIIEQAPVDDILDYICQTMVLDTVHFLWRPFLRDADDDMVLEAAVAGGCSHVITHNTRDFNGVEEFGLGVLTPGQFLRLLRGA